MRKTLLLVASLLSINCYAKDLVLTQVLIEHIDKMPAPVVKTKNATCTAMAEPASSTVDIDVTAYGRVSFTLINDSDISQVYWVDEYMCINGFGCTHVRNSTSLSPHKYGSGTANLGVKIAILDAGVYIDEASIQITGESTCFVQGDNYVNIS